MHANIVEQGYHLWTRTGRESLLPLNLYRHLAMEDAAVRALCSETRKIAGAGEVTSGVGLNHKRGL